MMKLTEIVVEVWNIPSRPYTMIRRYYDNPYLEHVVRLYPNEVETSLYNGNMNHPIKPGIQHLTRPST